MFLSFVPIANTESTNALHVENWDLLMSYLTLRLLHPGNNAEAEELQNKIAAGEPFACPIHNCHVCKEVETRSMDDLQFAVCRRCPKAYHRKCLPSEISFDDDDEDGTIPRAWEGLIPKRMLIYCLDHEIDEDLDTPSRDHIIFTGPQQEKRKTLESNKNKNLLKARIFYLENDAGNKILKNSKNRVTRCFPLQRERLSELSTSSSLKLRKLAATRNFREKLKESATDEAGLSSVYRSYADLCSTDSEPVNSCKGATRDGKTEITKKVSPTVNRTYNNWTLDADARRR